MYNTYRVSFRGRYKVRNPDEDPRETFVPYRFPSKEGLYDFAIASATSEFLVVS